MALLTQPPRCAQGCGNSRALVRGDASASFTLPTSGDVTIRALTATGYGPVSVAPEIQLTPGRGGSNGPNIPAGCTSKSDTSSMCASGCSLFSE